MANPVDIVSSAHENYGHALRALLSDENVDACIVICIPLEARDATAVASEIAEVSRCFEGKPVLANLMTTAHGVPSQLRDIPNFTFPESAAAALARVVHYGDWLRRPVGTPPEFPDLDVRRVRHVAEGVLSRGGGWLTPGEAHEFLQAAGVAVAREQSVAVDAAAVREAALEIGFPVAIKAIGPGILHKTEVGAVCLHLNHEEELLEAFEGLRQRLGDRMSGVVVQEMVPEGVEMVVGASLDPMFGPILMYGTGGVRLELNPDVAFALHPLTAVEVDEMLERVKGTALLRGWRGAPKADEVSLREVLLRLSVLLDLCPEIHEIDINPLKIQPVREAGGRPGAIAVDARIKISRAEVSPSRRIVY